MKARALFTLLACCLAIGAGGCDSDDSDDAGGQGTDTAAGAAADARTDESGANGAGSDADGSGAGGSSAGSADSGGSASGGADGGAGTEDVPALPGSEAEIRARLALGNACLVARGQRPAPKPPRNREQLAPYARDSLTRALSTASALRQADVPPASRDAVRRLEAEYAQLLQLLQRAASAKGPSATAMLPQVQSAVRAVNSTARAAGIAPCGLV